MLGSSLAYWEAAGYLSTGVVLIGVIGESIIEFTKLVKSPRWRSTVGIASALVLIVGLAGEILTQFKVNSVSGQMIAFLNKEAAQANLETERIRERLAWRRLDPEQIPKCISELSNFPRQGVMAVNLVNDPEVIQLSTSVSELFSRSGWDAIPTWTNMGPANGTGISVSVAIGSPSIDDDAAKLIVSCLNLSILSASLGAPFSPKDVIGIAGGGVMGPRSGFSESIMLWIGAKPLK